MYKDIITGLTNSANTKKNLLESSLFKYMLASVLAGFFYWHGNAYNDSISKRLFSTANPCRKIY